MGPQTRKVTEPRIQQRRPHRAWMLGGLAVSAALAVIACAGSYSAESAPVEGHIVPVAGSSSPGGAPRRVASSADSASEGTWEQGNFAEAEEAAAPTRDDDSWGAFHRSADITGHNTESYDSIVENRFVSPITAPLSTFSVDVDTASYSNLRRFLKQGTKPPAGAVRIEELVNYFDYSYDAPTDGRPFAVYTEVSTAPWAEDHQLLHIGLQGKRISSAELPARNLVFLLDVSGSMNDENKLPLLKRSLGALLETMGDRDTVSVVVYAGASGLVLPPTSASRREVIMGALERLEAGGSTNGGEGIELAYQMARRNFREDGVNRVILATDGDFNVGTTSQSELVQLIERKRNDGVFLTVLGFGMGNYQDSTLEKLADKGNGNYAYIDTFAEARKVLVQEGAANLITIAKDVKIQVEMNPALVGAYRLIGYENRVLNAEDFDDDAKDAGEIGAGHTVTALYEILSPEQARALLPEQRLRYGQADTRGWREPTRAEAVGASVAGSPRELCHVKLRYKEPTADRSQLIEFPVSAKTRTPSRTSAAFRFSAAVASFGMLMRGSEYAGNSNFGLVQRLAQSSVQEDPHGYRREFLGLAESASRLN